MGREPAESTNQGGRSHADEGGWVGHGDVHDEFRALLEELDVFLTPFPSAKLSENVLPLASAWVLNDAGFDLERYTDEARRFVEQTPEHDRVLRSFREAVTYYLALQLMMNEDGDVDPELARERLERARRALEDRAVVVENAFPTVARGFRLLLEETAAGVPPEDRLWRAMALRIGEQVMPRPGWSS